MSTRKDASSAGIRNDECPAGLDMCFNYCVTFNSWFPEITTGCAYGCMRSSNKPAMELMVSSMLSELDYQNRQNSRNSHHRSTLTTIANPGAVIYNPVEYTCGKAFEEKIGWLRYMASTTSYVYTSTYGCETVFCTHDGCNQRANGFTGYSWFHTYIYNPVAYGAIGLLFLAPLALIVWLCCRSCAASQNRYAEIPSQAPLAVPSRASQQVQPC